MRAHSLAPGTRRRAMPGIATAVLFFLTPEDTRAGCNLIPTAAQELASSGAASLPGGGSGPEVSGYVDRAVASPGDMVTVRSDVGCTPGNPGFALPDAPQPNIVRLLYRSPNGPVTEVTVPPATIEPVRCGALRCRAVRFEIPDTTSFVAGGLTGPVEILVEREIAGSTVVVARVHELFQTTRSCQPQFWSPDTVFGTFSVLPAPNALAVGTLPNVPGLLGAVDGLGNLLVPLDFSPVLDSLQIQAGAPEVTLLNVVSTNAAILTALGDASTGSEDLRSFNAFGRPIPPLFRLVREPATDPAFLATTDVVRSVIRVQALTGLDYAALMRTDGGGQAVGAVQLLGATVSVQSVAPLESLRTSLEAVALGIDEARVASDLTGDGELADLVVEITDVATGARVQTDQALTRTGPDARTAALDTEGPHVALLESEAAAEERLCPSPAAPPCPGLNGDGDFFDHVLRVYRNVGGGAPPAPVTILGDTPVPAVEPEPRVDGRSLVVSGDEVFYRESAQDQATRDLEPPAPGTEAEFATGIVSITPDARQVAFYANPVEVPVNLPGQVYVLDRQTATIERISEDPLTGVAGSASDEQPSISTNGRFVGLLSASSFGLAAAPGTHFYVFDRQLDTVRRASTDASGIAPNVNCFNSRASLIGLSDDGRWAAFACSGTLIPGDPVGFNTDVYLKDLQTEAIVRLNDGATGDQGGAQYFWDMTPDGRYVVFSTSAEDMVPGGPTDSCEHLYVYDRLSDTREIIDRRFDGGFGCGSWSGDEGAAITPDGRYVAFAYAEAIQLDDLVADDTNFTLDIYVWDRNDGSLERVSLDNAGNQATGFSFLDQPVRWPGISDDGRYVSFHSRYPFVANDFAGSPDDDVFVYDRLTDSVEIASVRLNGGALSSRQAFAALSGDGRSVVFTAHPNESPPGAGTGLQVRRTGSGLGEPPRNDLRSVNAVTGSGGPPLPIFLPDVEEAAVASPAKAVGLVRESSQGNLNDAPRLPGANAETGPGADTDDLVAQILFPSAAPGAQHKNLGVAVSAGRADIGAATVCLGVSESGQAGSDLNGDGDSDDHVLAVGGTTSLFFFDADLTNVGVAVDAIGAAAQACVFLRPEAAESGSAPLCQTVANPVPDSCDLNGDGDAGDRVLHAVEVIEDVGGNRTVNLRNLGWSAEDFIVSEGGALVAFRTSEAAETRSSGTPPGCLATSNAGECDLNGDGDILDAVMQVIEFPTLGVPAVSRELFTIDTFREAILCTFAACDAFELYRVEETGSSAARISFLGTEPGQAVGLGCLSQSPPGDCDLDGNARGGDTVVHVGTLSGGLLNAIQTLPADPDATSPFFPAERAGQTVATVTKTECEAARYACPELQTSSFGATFAYPPGSCAAELDADPDGSALNANDVAGSLDCVTPRNWIVGDSDRAAGSPAPDGSLDFASNFVNDLCRESPDPGQDDSDADGLGDSAGASCDPDPASLPPSAENCDLDENGHIDRRDVDLIVEAVPQRAVGFPALGWDRRDRNADGVLTTFDSVLCQAECTRGPSCKTPGACGLLGVEALLPLGVFALRRRGARR